MKHSLSLCIIIAFLQSVLSINAQDFLSVVPSSGSLLNSVQGDLYIKPESGRASEYQPGEGIENSFDGSMTSLYHSRWYAGTVFPVTLDYMFADTVSQIDYVIYYPRTEGSNGNFKEVELWYAANGQPMTKYRDYDFGGSGMPSTMVFDPAILRPETIRFVVKSGTGDGEGNYVSCAEMEFYRKNADTFAVSDIFTDAACSELKPGVTLDDINAITEEFYRKLASDIYYGFYDPEFRVQECQARQTPEIMAAINKTNNYGRRDNPTGIYVGANTEVVLLVETAFEQMPSLFIHDITTTAGGRTYLLRRGVNKIKALTGGLMYIYYYTQTGTEPPVKINIVNGIVKGYYDKARHTAADWPRLLANATYPLFEMKGDYAFLCFETDAFRTYATSTGADLLDAYDELVYLEMDFQGMVKHNKMFTTRMHFQVDPNPNSSWMYASSYYTGYNKGTQSSILNLAQLKDRTNFSGAASWGPAHEVGHANQTRPGLRWIGTVEVTNNILSQYVTTYWGVRSRLITGDCYTKGVNEIVKDAAKATYLQHNDVFLRLVPFWQLKLYLMDALGQEDFYRDLYEKIRVNPDPTAKYGSSADAMCQLEFVRLVCEVSGYDMTGFFTDWKFLTPVSITVSDYGTAQFTITQQAVDAIKAEMVEKGLPKPPVPAGKNLYDIDDNNWRDYIP